MHANRCMHCLSIAFKWSQEISGPALSRKTLCFWRIKECYFCFIYQSKVNRYFNRGQSSFPWNVDPMPTIKIVSTFHNNESIKLQYLFKVLFSLNQNSLYLVNQERLFAAKPQPTAILWRNQYYCYLKIGKRISCTLWEFKSRDLILRHRATFKGQ